MIMKPTTQQIDEQVELERSAIKEGLKRLHDQTLKLENQDYGSATIYGISSIPVSYTHLTLPTIYSV